jgi:hypothetical protein
MMCTDGLLLLLVGLAGWLAGWLAGMFDVMGAVQQ